MSRLEASARYKYTFTIVSVGVPHGGPRQAARPHICNGTSIPNGIELEGETSGRFARTIRRSTRRSSSLEDEIYEASISHCFDRGRRNRRSRRRSTASVRIPCRTVGSRGTMQRKDSADLSYETLAGRLDLGIPRRWMELRQVRKLRVHVERDLLRARDGGSTRAPTDPDRRVDQSRPVTQPSKDRDEADLQRAMAQRVSAALE